MSNRAARIEAKARELGLSVPRLARLADVSESSVRRVFSQKQSVSDEILTALEVALIGAQRGSDEPSPISALWRLSLFLMASDIGVPLATIDSEDANPKRKATNNPEWMLAAKVRRRTVYFLNTVFGYRQHQLVTVTGLTPAGVSRICHEIEDERDEDPALDLRFDQLSRELMGGV